MSEQAFEKTQLEFSVSANPLTLIPPIRTQKKGGAKKSKASVSIKKYQDSTGQVQAILAAFIVFTIIFIRIFSTQKVETPQTYTLITDELGTPLLKLPSLVTLWYRYQAAMFKQKFPINKI